MENMSISQVSKGMGISTRMLRYYEQAGLIKSYRQEGYAYRMYDQKAISQIQQIILLRKLRISLRQIKVILENERALTAIKIFQQNIKELNEEITALSTIRNILDQFIDELSKTTALPLHHIISQNDTIQHTINSLKQISINFKEEQTMEKLKQANENLSKINDVRIIYLPPFYVASAHHIGDDPELIVNAQIDAFVSENKLHKIKPDIRLFGFNHPNPIDESGYHGYEAWVTIPDDMEVPAPLKKKQFPGGLYAAHMIPFGNFNEWDMFLEWVMKSDIYEFMGDLQDQEHMCGLLEEHLNYYTHIDQGSIKDDHLQLDLLIPIAVKNRE